MLGVFSLCVGYFFGGASREGKPPPDFWRLCCQKKKALPLIPPAVQASFGHHFRCFVLFCLFVSYRSFSLSRNKKFNWKPSRGRSQENEML